MGRCGLSHCRLLGTLCLRNGPKYKRLDSECGRPCKCDLPRHVSWQAFSPKFIFGSYCERCYLRSGRSHGGDIAGQPNRTPQFKLTHYPLFPACTGYLDGPSRLAQPCPQVVERLTRDINPKRFQGNTSSRPGTVTRRTRDRNRPLHLSTAGRRWTAFRSSRPATLRSVASAVKTPAAFVQRFDLFIAPPVQLGPARCRR